jgi:hypothetical protein
LAIVHELTSFEKALTGKKCLLPDIQALPADGFAGGSVKSGSIVAGFSLPPITEPSLFNYDGFSDILVIDRSVREPLEEYVFRRLMRVTPDPRHPGLVR